MDSESINNLYYRYELTDNADISSETFQRRMYKSAQNNRNAFFFDLQTSKLSADILTSFFKQYLKPNDLLALNYDDLSLFKLSAANKQIIIKIKNKDEFDFINTSEKNDYSYLCSPLTKNDLDSLVLLHDKVSKIKLFWSFSPYKKEIKDSLTVNDINKYHHLYNKIKGLEIFNSHIPQSFELIPSADKSYTISWHFKSLIFNPLISVIIPTHNNLQFLSNVILHLTKQNISLEDFEIIIVDDGSSDFSSEILKDLFMSFQNKMNLKYIYWSKEHPEKGPQHFFRAGQARNLGVSQASAEKVIFLDSDMLVPENFLQLCIQNISEKTLIQFQRFHINQLISTDNRLFKDINVKTDTYIEESHYWSEFFFCDNWKSLPCYWKFTCTYALGIYKKDFIKLGQFKKYYVSYGFEDTDLGYEASLNEFDFKLVKSGLLHQTAYNKMQYSNSKLKRYKLLKKTAELFYLQHLDDKIYKLLGNYYRFQKPIKSLLRDFLT